MPAATIDEAIAAIAAGRMVVVVDDEDRENEGDLIVAAEYATPEVMAFFVRHTSGLDLRIHHLRAGRRAGPAADGGPQHRVTAHRLHRHRRLPHGHHDRNLGHGPVVDGPGAGRTPIPGPRTWPAPATSMCCGPGRAAS